MNDGALQCNLSYKIAVSNGNGGPSRDPPRFLLTLGAAIGWCCGMSEELFATAAEQQLSKGLIDGRIPYLTIDGIFADPSAVRAAALTLPYSSGTAHYPGRVARFPAGDSSLTRFLRQIIGIVTSEYLPHLPPARNGKSLSRVRGVDTDFAVTDKHPAELSANQRAPHIDAVPVFGLVYLNDPPRGGTLFFRPRGHAAGPDFRPGYPRSDELLEVCGHIEGRFNRLAVYPGFVLHSGEIAGEWIENDDRFTYPRLTQRIMFFF